MLPSFRFGFFLTSTVHKFPDISGGHYMVATQIVGKLTTDGHNNGHDKVGKCRNYAHLDERERQKVFMRQIGLICVWTTVKAVFL